MKAAICYEYGKPLVMEEVELDPVGKRDVKVRMAATAICHSDIHAIKGEHGNLPLPAIPGHEIAGFVEEVGKDVSYVKPGDAVIASIIPEGCGDCYYCRIGSPSLCQTNRLYLFGKGKYTSKTGQRISQYAGAVAGFVQDGKALHVMGGELVHHNVERFFRSYGRQVCPLQLIHLQQWNRLAIHKRFLQVRAGHDPYITILSVRDDEVVHMLLLAEIEQSLR